MTAGSFLGSRAPLQIGHAVAALLLLEDVKHSTYEPRFHALGRTDEDRLLHISFTLRGEGRLVRVISARDMHRKERDRYEQET